MRRSRAQQLGGQSAVRSNVLDVYGTCSQFVSHFRIGDIANMSIQAPLSRKMLDSLSLLNGEPFFKVKEDSAGELKL